MLRLFRRLRARLINSPSNSNTTSTFEERTSSPAGKYLLYALGEIALVVIGILIALQINNWNTYAQERKQERQYLLKLHDDLVNDTLSLNGVLRQINAHVNNAFDVIGFMETGEIQDTVALVRSMIYAGYLNFFNPNLSTYNDLISTGNVRLIQDRELKEKLDQYVSYLQQIRERYELNKKMVWFDYGGYYRRNYLDGRIGDYSSITTGSIRSYPVDWKRLQGDQELKNMLTWIIGGAESERRWQSSTKNRVVQLIEHLNGLIND